MWDISWYTRTEHCITILYHAIENTHTAMADLDVDLEGGHPTPPPLILGKKKNH